MSAAHGLKIVDPERERAYLIYRSQARRSLRETARTLGIPEGTVLSWSRDDGWQQRLRDDDDRAIATMRRDAELALLGKHDLLIEQMWDTALHAKDERVKADMLKFIADDHLPATAYTAKSPAELRAIVAKHLAAEAVEVERDGKG